jgi:hypothetical protein
MRLFVDEISRGRRGMFGIWLAKKREKQRNWFIKSFSRENIKNSKQIFLPTTTQPLSQIHRATLNQPTILPSSLISIERESNFEKAILMWYPLSTPTFKMTSTTDLDKMRRV